MYGRYDPLTGVTKYTNLINISLERLVHIERMSFEGKTNKRRGENLIYCLLRSRKKKIQARRVSRPGGRAVPVSPTLVLSPSISSLCSLPIPTSPLLLHEEEWRISVHGSRSANRVGLHCGRSCLFFKIQHIRYTEGLMFANIQIRVINY